MPIASPLIDETETTFSIAARWIAPPGDLFDNYTFLARGQFELAEVPPRAILRIAAESRYVVYVNGRRVGQGPIRGTDARYFFDSYDVAAALRSGVNFIAARVHCPVKPLTSAVPPVRPALLAELRSSPPSRGGIKGGVRTSALQDALLLATDSSWQARIDPSCRADAPFYTHHIGYSEYRDMRKEPRGWQTFADGPENWQPAIEVAPADGLGGRILVPRPIAALTDDELRPARVAEAASVPVHLEGVEEDVDYAALMQAEMHFAPDQPRFESLEGLTTGTAATVHPSFRLTPGAKSQGACVMLDFARELCGQLILDVEGPEAAIVDVGYDEDIVDRRIDPRRVNANGAIYRFADRYILRNGRQRIETRIHDRGLRVVQLVFRRFADPIRIHSITVANRTYPIPIEADFECDQQFLNRLWAKCVATMQACSLDLFVDCPWREQTLWLDDHHQENLFYLSMTSDRIFPAHNLRVSADGAMPSGMLPARYPSRRELVLPCTAANWISCVRDYYQYTGDDALVRELLPVVDRALACYEGWREADGLVPDQQGPGVWNFIDWGYAHAGVELGGKTAPLNLLIAAGFKQAAELHAAAGHSERAADLHRTADDMAAAVQRQFWLPDEKRLYDCTRPLGRQGTFSQAPHAVGLYFDLIEEAHRREAVDAILHPEAIRAEYGYQLFVLESLARHGRAADALRIVRDLWGHMVRSPSPTLWEVAAGRSAMSGCGSLCHGFSCAPMHFMQTTLLGVRPVKPGFAEFALDPAGLGVLWARGRVPTPHGPIRVSWSVQDDHRLLLDVCVPPNTAALLPGGRRLPLGEHRACIVLRADAGRP